MIRDLGKKLLYKTEIINFFAKIDGIVIEKNSSIGA